jgi:apolipoprotein N-acyltransferase
MSQTETPALEPRPAEPAAARASLAPPRAWLRSCLLPATLSGVVLWMCHFPLAWGWLGWVALVPLLCLVRSTARPRAVYFSAWVGALLFFVPVLQWMRVADDAMYATWLMLALYCASLVPLGLWLVRRLDRCLGLPLVLTVPVVWTALDYFRAIFLEGFAWYFLGHTQHNFLPVIQIADLAGVYAVTFLVAAVNALAFEWLCRMTPFRRLFLLPQLPRSSALNLWTAAVGVLLAATLSYGFWRLREDDFADGPRVALLQGNVPQGIRNKTSAGDLSAADFMFDHYDFLSDAAARQEPRPDLIVWPETCFPDEWCEVAPELSPDKMPQDWKKWVDETSQMARNAPRRWPTNVLLGMNSRVLGADEKTRRYNSSVLILKSGQAAGRYDKMHLVPFGEYVPLRDSLPLMNWLSPYDFDYSVTPGKEQTRFALGDYRFGMVICYEDSDPYLARQYVRDGKPKVDFLVNTSNDGWFDGTSEHDEHLAVARFRAIECRRTLVRAVNMGISAVIDPNGRVLAPQLVGTVRRNGHEAPLWEVRTEKGQVADLPLSRWGEFKKVHGVLTAVVPIDTRSSLYAAWGDWLPGLCWLGLIVGLVGTVWRPRPGVDA